MANGRPILETDYEPVALRPSTRASKKWMVVFRPRAAAAATGLRERAVHFGATGYEDFTTHRDVARRERYRVRHAGEGASPAATPGHLAYHLLWGDTPSLRRQFARYKRAWRARAAAP